MDLHVASKGSSTNYPPILWYIVFAFSKCSLEIVGNYTRSHNSCTVGRHKQCGFYTLKGNHEELSF